jgi:hypothetical protein
VKPAWLSFFVNFIAFPPYPSFDASLLIFCFTLYPGFEESKKIYIPSFR